MFAYKLIYLIIYNTIFFEAIFKFFKVYCKKKVKQNYLIKTYL